MMMFISEFQIAMLLEDLRESVELLDFARGCRDGVIFTGSRHLNHNTGAIR